MEEVIKKILKLALDSKMKLECYITEKGLDLSLVLDELFKLERISKEEFNSMQEEFMSMKAQLIF